MLCRMDCGLSYAPCPVTDLHAPALKAVGEGVRHGIAEGTHLVFQLLLDLPALCFPHFIVSRSFIKFFSPFCRTIPADDRTGDP